MRIITFSIGLAATYPKHKASGVQGSFIITTQLLKKEGTVEGAQRAPFGETLATFRTRADLSQQQLADQLGKTRRAVAAWEAGEYLPKAKGDVLSIARILKLDEEETTILLTAAGMDPLLSLWNVPYHRNPYFTGRDELLQQLDQYLAPPERMASAGSRRVALTQPHAVTGLGGIGKTQIAVEYAYRSSELGRYTHTLWVNAATKESILASFVEIAALLPAFAGRNETDQSKLIEAVKRWLEQCKQPWLLIFDNVDHDGDLPAIRKYLPQRGYGSVLLTTRASAVGSLATSLEVKTMGFVEGTQLLLRRAHRVANAFDLEHASDEEINRVNRAGNIVQILDHFPLALDQAGAYIEETQCSLEEYIDLYLAHRQEFLAKRGKLATDYPDSVATTWSLSFQRVQQANPAAAEFLQLCAFLAPDRIPEELLQDGAAYWPSLLQQAAADRFKINQMIEELLKYSLVKRLVADRFLSIHRLVQAVQKDMMELEVQQQWAERTIKAVNKVFPEHPEDAAIWSLCLRYLDQVQICNQLLEEYTLSLIEAADLLNRAGLYLHIQVSHTLAEPLLKRSLAIYEQQLGLEHPSPIHVLSNLADLYVSQGDHAEAESLYLRALAICKEQLGLEHLTTATCLNGLALLYLHQGRYAEAEPLLKFTLFIFGERLGLGHPTTATSLNNLAVVLREQGKYAEAEPLLKRALEINEQQLGANHPTTAFSLNTLAELYKEQGKYAEAEPLLRRSLSIREQQWGPEHPHTATNLNNLAVLYQHQGKYAEAESLLKRALAIGEQHWGPEHLTVANRLNSLASLYREQGKYEEAESLQRRALTIREQQLGTTHPYTASSLNNLATIYVDQRKYEEAEPLLKRSLAIYEQQSGPEHSDTARSLHNLAELYRRQGKNAEAEPLLKRALMICESALGREHPDTLTVRKGYIALLRTMGDDEEARKLEES
jgi:tetratricopeptide (TPR) repeat protein/transcriptional regulator with XRE-family HTH domain